MEIQDRETLGRFAREHHVTYELEPEGSFAERLISTGDAPRWTEIAPPGAPALYQSAEVPGADEVALAMRVRRDPRDGGTAKPSDDPHVGEIRARLEAVGAHRR